MFVRDGGVVPREAHNLQTRVQIPVPQHFDSLRSLSASKNKRARRSAPSLPKGYDEIMWFVYILECEDGSFYTGITDHIQRRFSEHRNGKGGHYTSSHEPRKLLYSEKHNTKSGALKRERQIKGWRKEKKLKLINLSN